MEKKLFDKRIVERYIAKGFVKGSEWESKMKALPDDTANCERVVIDLEETEIGAGEGSSLDSAE